MKSVLISLHPKWVGLILNGRKTIEVRKRAPRLQVPFKLYLYCTKEKEPSWLVGIRGKRESYKMNGLICGEVTCVGITEDKPPFREKLDGTCLTAKELYAYVGVNDKLCFMRLQDPITYDKPKSLKDFGQDSPPQSWRYVEVEE